MRKHHIKKALATLASIGAVVGIARVGVGCGGGGAPIRDQVNDELKRIINDCRGAEMNQLPGTPGPGTICDGVSCPDKVVNDIPKAECERSFDYQVEIDRMGKQTCKGTATLVTTEAKSCSHNHQGTCDTSGTCAAEYVNRTATVTATAKLECTILVSGTPYKVDVSGSLGGYNRNWTFHDKVAHGGARTCGPSPSPSPTVSPSPSPTVSPSPSPTVSPSPSPTVSPSPSPTVTPTPSPTVSPTPRPTSTPMMPGGF